MNVRSLSAWLRTLGAAGLSALALLVLFHLELPGEPTPMRAERPLAERAPTAKTGTTAAPAVTPTEEEDRRPRVPSLLGQPLGRARRDAREGGLTLIARDEDGRKPFRNALVLWRVEEQDPSPGGAMPKDGVVRVTVSANWSFAEGY